MQLTELSDEALLSQVAAICLEGHALTARLVVFLIEIEERRLDLKAACTSMFDYCVRRLGMSEGVAFRRINAARLVKRFPALLARIESGELCLSTLVLLRPHLIHLDDAKAYALASDVAGKTLREVEQLFAASAPQPPRFKMQLTASSELRDKLERARDLMSHANPSGDLAVVVERALDLLLERLEKERLGKTTRPPRQAATTRGRDARGDWRRDGRFHAECAARCSSATATAAPSSTPRAVVVLHARDSSSITSRHTPWEARPTPRTCVCSAERTIAFTPRMSLGRSTSRARSTFDNESRAPSRARTRRRPRRARPPWTSRFAGS